MQQWKRRHVSHIRPVPFSCEPRRGYVMRCCVLGKNPGGAVSAFNTISPSILVKGVEIPARSSSFTLWTLMLARPVLAFLVIPAYYVRCVFHRRCCRGLIQYVLVMNCLRYVDRNTRSIKEVHVDGSKKMKALTKNEMV